MSRRTQASKKSRLHKKQSRTAGLYVNTAHPAHSSDWRRSTNSIVDRMDQHGTGVTALYHAKSCMAKDLGISNSVNIKNTTRGGDK